MKSLKKKIIKNEECGRGVGKGARIRSFERSVLILTRVECEKRGAFGVRSKTDGKETQRS